MLVINIAIRIVNIGALKIYVVEKGGSAFVVKWNMPLVLKKITIKRFTNKFKI